MQKYALRIAYHGHGYCGWQKQKTKTDARPSIQGTLEKTIQKMTSEPVSVHGSGRTDAGVHALGQVAHFTLKKRSWDKGILLKGLNALLPQKIRILEVHPVSSDFHAQQSALKKQYSYYFQQGPSELPHLRDFTYWIRKPLNVSAMQKGIKILSGRHDFKPFQASGSHPAQTTTREILQASVKIEPVMFPGWVSEKNVFLVRATVTGTGFLKQMVRGIAGTLRQIGEGKRPYQCMEEILQSRDRSLVGPTAPARGLWLEKVWYDEI